MKWFGSFLVLLFVVVMAACSDDETEVWADEFERGCQWDSECSPIVEGDMCECHVCDNAAIHEDAVDDYWSTRELRQCSPPPECPAIGCGEHLVAHCGADDLCELRQGVVRGEDDFDRSCQDNEDCALVSFGEVCRDCAICSNGAINADAVDEFDAAGEGVVCRSNVDCDCVGMQPVCNLGRCEAEPVGM